MYGSSFLRLPRPTLLAVLCVGCINADAADFVVDEQYEVRCSGSGSSHVVPIKAKSTACASAMREFAEASSCNQIENLQAAQANYYRACASEMYE